MLNANNQSCSKVLTASHSAALGVTLVELLTTIVLIGILSAVALPRFFDTSAFAQRGYVDEVASALRSARTVAVASDCAVRFITNPADYRVVQRDAQATCNTAGNWTLAVSNGDGSPLLGNAPAGVVMAPATTIDFARDGSIPAGVPPVLRVGAYSITIDRWSGAVTVAP